MMENEDSGNRDHAECWPRRLVRLFSRPWFLALAVVAIGFHIATAGLEWSENFHPDERVISEWVAEVHDEGYITGRGYPGGWFELNRVRIWFQKRIDCVMRAWHAHSVQDGAVVAVSENSFTYQSAPPFKSLFDNAQAGRDFNAALYVLSSLLMYLTALAAGMGAPAAFLSALFFFAYAAPIEFVHYCESDGGLIFTLALSAWLFAKALQRQSPVWTVLAAFSAGFAISTKPTLFPLVLPVLAVPWAVCLSSPKLRQKRYWLIPLLTVLCLAALAWGFTTGTPAIRENLSWYLESMRETSRKTYAELQRNMGGNATFRFASILRARNLAENIGELGLFPVTWGLFAWLLWFKRDFRRQLAGVPMLLPLFPLFAVLCCPFVRRQETLPIGMLMALGMGLPLEAFLRRLKAERPLTFRGAATMVLCGAVCILALWEGAGKSAGMVQCFQLRDTRAEAQNWLKRTWPRGVALGFDRYTGQAARGVDCDVAAFGGLPYRWQGLPLSPDRPSDPWPSDGKPVEYYIENVGFTGRYPITNPKTGAIRKDVREKMAAYEDAAFDCRIWSAGSHSVRPTFGQPTLRMVSFVKPDAGAVDIPLSLPRPLFFQPIRTSLYGTGGGAGLGSIAAIPTYGRFSPVYYHQEDGPLWIVTRMLEGEAKTKVLREGTCGKSKEALPQGGIIAARLGTGPVSRFLGRFSAYRAAAIRVRGAGQSGGCYSYIANSPEELAREMRLGGNPSGALALLEKEKGLSAAAKVEAFMCAAYVGETIKEEWIVAARDALAATKSILNAKESPRRTSVTIRGVPLGIVNDFARMRIARGTVFPGQRLLVFLPAGNYTLKMRFPDEVASFAEALAPHALFEGQPSPFSLAKGEGFVELEATLVMKKGAIPNLRAIVGLENQPLPCELEIAWDPIAQIRDASSELESLLGKVQ